MLLEIALLYSAISKNNIVIGTYFITTQTRKY